MKRLFIILGMFAVMITAAILEQVYCEKFFDATLQNLNQLEQSMLINEGQINNPETIDILDRTMAKWYSGEKYALMIGNHTVIRNACERLVALEGFVRLNEWADARVNLKQSHHYIQDLKTDSQISITNFL